MNQDITPKQALFLWKMITGLTPEVREPMQSKATPKLNTAEKKVLLDEGYLSVDKRGRRSHLVMTDKAWAWAERSEDVQFSNSKEGAAALQGLLKSLLPFLHEHELPLATVFSGRKGSRGENSHAEAARTDTASGVSSELDVVDLVGRVEATCLELTNGRRQQRVRLSALRDALATVPRHALDQALLALQDAERAVLYRDDNSAALSEADHAAALVVGEAPRHIIYLEA
jgi:hypothetical protein